MASLLRRLADSLHGKPAPSSPPRASGTMRAASPSPASSTRIAAAAPSRGGARRTIVVVEEDAALRDALVAALEREYDVFAATDGVEASELVSTLPTPALIVTSVALPRVDGFSFARKLKSDPRLKAVPIIFLGARSSASDVIEAINLGARSYVHKPIKVEELVEKVARALR